MKLFILILPFFLSYLFADNNIWTKNTPTMSEQKAQQIIQSYIENNNTHIKLENDPQEIPIYDFKKNIFVLGLELSYDANNERVYNTTGERVDNFSSQSIKLTLAKDFTIWHKEYTQPSRLYISYSLSFLDDGVTYNTTSFGLKENMYYWSIYREIN